MADSVDTGLLCIPRASYVELPLSDSLAWLHSRIDKFVRGGIYLLAGQPGIGKSTLGIQIALDLGRQDIKSLIVLTEVNTTDLGQRARMLCSDWPIPDAERALRNVKPEENRLCAVLCG